MAATLWPATIAGCTEPMPMAMLTATRLGDILHLTLDRPQRHNAFDDSLIAELTAQLDLAAADDGLRALVLAGNGPSFSAGADLGWMQRMSEAGEQDNIADALSLARLMRSLNNLPMPTIAAVHGSVFGGGVGLVACCDIAIATDDARFGLTEVRLGLLPAVISPYVIAAIGPRQARRWFTTGEPFDAARAQAIGLVHEVVAADALQAAVQQQLALIARAGPQASRQAKTLVRSVIEADDATALDLANARRIAGLRAAPEGREGLAAFLAKRPANWVGPA
jgi:methylglutaconyl-CoA hydratase